MKVRIYTIEIPAISMINKMELAEKIYDYLGPAVIDFTGWGLLRPGLLNKRLIINVCNIWRAERKKEFITDRPQISGEWIFFDYLFSKTASINPIIKCLTAAGLTKYGEIKLTNTYLITVGINCKQGMIIMLYNGKKIETQLDDLAYVLSHILKASKIKAVEINKSVIVKFATYLKSSLRWQLKGWVSKEGRTIELDLVQKNMQEYLDKLKKGEWQSLLFKNNYSKIKLTIKPKTQRIDVFIRSKFYTPGPKRDLRPIFEELARGITPEKVADIVPSSKDESGILRAYTERRGIVAVLNLEREKYGREAHDLSYTFQGYDIKSGPILIEVKAFKNTSYKSIQLTQNEYQTLLKEENYHIYVVEEAWSDNPKINIINEPKEIHFTRQSENIIETRIATEEYYECEEEEWRRKVVKTDSVKL
jgi:hypothetical protein